MLEMGNLCPAKLASLHLCRYKLPGSSALNLSLLLAIVEEILASRYDPQGLFLFLWIIRLPSLFVHFAAHRLNLSAFCFTV